MVEPRPEEDLPLPAAAPAPPSRAPVALATLAVVIAAGALAGILRFMIVTDKLEARLNKLETQAIDHDGYRELQRQVQRVNTAVTFLSDEQVNLMDPKFQQLHYGFAVSDLSLARKDNGVVVTGRLINGNSLTHRDVVFRIKIGNAGKEFAVRLLPPGGTAVFEVVLPNVPLDSAGTATLSKVSSAVVFDH